MSYPILAHVRSYRTRVLRLINNASVGTLDKMTVSEASICEEEIRMFIDHLCEAEQALREAERNLLNHGK